jgi:ribosome-associated protein
LAERGAGKPPVKARGKGARPAPEAIQSDDYAAAQSVSVLETAQRIAAIAQDKLAEDVLILDMREFCSFTDYFVIASGRNARQVKGIFDETLVKLKQESRLIPRAIAGEREADWIVIDYIDVVVHVFTPEQRAYYRLEELWSDVPRVELDASDAA